MISFDEFSKIELRIATILSVDDIPRKDKLYCLTISLGEEQRTLVAGIKQFYSKEELVGKQIVIVANLEPRTLGGVESQGMLLAADVERKPILIQPDQEVPSGARVG